MNTKLPYIIGGAVVLILVIFLATNGQSQTKKIPSKLNQMTNTMADTSPSSTSQNPQDVVPGLYKNPIQNIATKTGFTISSVAVENNTDPVTGKPIGDHLELTLKNATNQDLSSFAVYYTIADTVTNKKEGYYKELLNFVLKANETKTVHFDNKQGEGHFTTNTNSLYFTSANKLQFAVMVSTPGYKIETTTVGKAAGGAETKD